ncbi:MAG: carbohydrate-binding protein, partial [Moraxellaceae bacterium]
NGGWTSNQLTASGAFTKDIISNWPGATPTECNEVAVPATIEAEKFCQMSGVETESTSDTNGGSNLGYIDQGDWMTYSVNVPASGSYTVSYRVASLNGGGVIQLEQAGGSPVFGSVNVAATSGWQNWTTVSHTVQLSAGRQRIAVAAKSGGFNLNWIKIQSNGSSSSSSSSSSSGSTPLATLQAESYRIMNGVQTEAASDVGGGLNVGYIDAGDWMSYDNTSVTVPETGTYTVQFRVASALSGGNLSFEEAGANSYASVAIPNTGGWQNWTTVKTSITLTAGTHKFGIKANTGGWNINWFSITKGIN